MAKRNWYRFDLKFKEGEASRGKEKWGDNTLLGASKPFLAESKTQALQMAKAWHKKEFKGKGVLSYSDIQSKAITNMKYNVKTESIASKSRKKAASKAKNGKPVRKRGGTKTTAKKSRKAKSRTKKR